MEREKKNKKKILENHCCRQRSIRFAVRKVMPLALALAFALILILNPKYKQLTD